MNMGPTGAAAWMRGYHFQVMRIDHGSPAHGALELGDVVIGADGTAFGPDADARITLGNAIGKAERSGTPLLLSVLRHGIEQSVSMTLPRLGTDATGWLFDDATSSVILSAACRSLLDAQLPNGRLPTDGDMGSFLAGLLLLASGDGLYLDGARRAAYYADSVDYLKLDYNNWPMGYGGLLLAEYYLSTGDDSVLGKLAWIADELARGQMLCGSWGHKSPGEGYGALNQPGVVDAIVLVLARECGITVDQLAMDKALAFFGRFAELGSVPYGDHTPGNMLDDNGKNASSAVLMHLAGRDREATAFSQSVAMSYWMREDGHTGAFFSTVWGPLGAALAGPVALREFLHNQGWYYHLIRTWKGELLHLPYQEALTRFDDSGYIYFGGDFTTGGIGLAYALPQRRLRILGASPSVFSPHTELSSPMLRDARQYYRRRAWEALDKTLAAISPADLATDVDKRCFTQLKDARALLIASTEQTLLEIESNLVNGAAYDASEQFQALKRGLGEQGDARFATLDERFADGVVAGGVREGKRYKDAWAALKSITVMSWTAQGWQARRLIEGLPTLRSPVWETLSPTAEMAPPSWRTLQVGTIGNLPVGWERPGFDDRAWVAGKGIALASDADAGRSSPTGAVAARCTFTVTDPVGDKLRVRLQTVRPAQTRVYLNGLLVVDAVRGQRGGYAVIELDDSALGLLHPGENLLAVMSTAQDAANNRLDVGLDLVRTLSERRSLPVDRIDAPPMDAYPGMDDTLRVRETRDRMAAALQARYDQKPVVELLSDLEHTVPYVRLLAENALVSKGPEGIKAVVAQVGHPDWKVRSSVCNVMGNALGRYRKLAASEQDIALLQADVPTLFPLLSDDHFWVRFRAASVLGGFGEAAAPVLPALALLVQDSEEWVRMAAIRTIRQLNPPPAVAVQAAMQVLMHPGSAYGVPDTAVELLKANRGATGDERLVALLQLLRHPPEGGGGRLLGDVMEMAATLDPEGARLIPVLIEAAADKTHLRRQRGNPRGKAIELLGRFGSKASGAVPVLEAILKSDADKSQHAVVQSALDAINAKP
ncbi:MAG TPA: hypothetical protein DCS43_07020 [Verrucomicrobia bacterium]|nr:hypothetical protein [Verrucomicrobiota bacterium]